MMSPDPISAVRLLRRHPFFYFILYAVGGEETKGTSARGMMSLDTMSAAGVLILAFCYFLRMLLVRTCRGLFTFLNGHSFPLWILNRECTPYPPS